MGRTGKVKVQEKRGQVKGQAKQGIGSVGNAQDR
jgi:hypothetical protein